MPQWTEEQKQTIQSRGQNLLVSAAAGSGKTAVLVQRILEKILDPLDPVEIDRLLVVTFTNAAAASLREKIRTRLEEEAEGNDPVRAEAAVRQLSMLAGDHIETIDRFCREIVLDHADALQIDPSFRIGDEGELQLLQSEAVSQVIEESLGDPDEERLRAFSEFALLYAPGKTDEGLEDLILDFYRFSMSHEFPRIWRHDCGRLYREDARDAQWMQDLFSGIRMRLEEIHDSLQEALACCSAAGGPYHYTQAVAEHEDLLNRLVHCASLSETSDLLRDYPWPRPGAKKRGKDAPPVDPVLEKQVKGIRERAKKALDDMTDRFFFAPEEQLEAMRLSTAGYMDTLIDLTDRFEQRYAKEKAARGIADFSDVAHWALRVLICMDEDGMPVLEEDGTYKKTRLAEEYRDYFQEIYIDEYQDSNRVQEILLQSIARPRGRFMVGDMKQSIYRFRMADTGIFLEKDQSYQEEEEAPDRKIILHHNFRSRACVLDAVNLVFRQVMRRELGGVDYTSAQELRAGYLFPEDDREDPGTGADGADTVPELLLAERGDVEEASSNAQAEAVVVAQRILDMVGKMRIYDKDEGMYRPVCYRDITILLRTASGWAQTFSRVLDEYGIPNRPDASTGYFDAVEVRTILAYLNVLDNPRQDIPLAASLRSSIGGMEDRELALVRSQTGDCSLYDSVVSYCASGKDPVIRGKLSHFMEMTRSLRALVKDTPIHVLLWKIFDVTGYEDSLAATEGGRQKKANLALLLDMAMAYEETSYRGLFHFARYIEKLRKAQKDIGQAAEGGRGGNLVRIMTMHKSKGLEFPVVFVSGLNKGFNLQDARGRIVMHERLGAGLDWRDPAHMGKMPNRIRSVIAQRVETDSIGEEARVLYVAMTRAEQKLILTACVDSRKKAVEKALAVRTNTALSLPVHVIGASSGMLDWILAALSRHGAEQDFFDSGLWEGPELRESEASSLPGRIRIRTGQEVLCGREKTSRQALRRLEDLLASDPDEVTDPALRRRLDDIGGMPLNAGVARIPGKLSVSEIKHEAYAAEMRRIMEEEGGAPYPEDREIEVPHPRFLREGTDDGKISGTAVGSAYHLVFASLDFTRDRTLEHVQALLETMLNCDKIQKEEASKLDVGKIASFLSSGLAGRMRRAALDKKLWREQPFVIGRDADTIRPDWSRDEQILLQGIIDAFFIEEGQVVLVDYKTDRARPGDEESLVRRYRTQFLLYADALEKLLGMPVKEAWLYSLGLQKAIGVDLSSQ